MIIHYENFFSLSYKFIITVNGDRHENYRVLTKEGRTFYVSHEGILISFTEKVSSVIYTPGHQVIELARVYVEKN